MLHLADLEPELLMTNPQSVHGITCCCLPTPSPWVALRSWLKVKSLMTDVLTLHLADLEPELPAVRAFGAWALAFKQLSAAIALRRDTEARLAAAVAAAGVSGALDGLRGAAPPSSVGMRSLRAVLLLLGHRRAHGDAPAAGLHCEWLALRRRRCGATPRASQGVASAAVARSTCMQSGAQALARWLPAVPGLLIC